MIEGMTMPIVSSTNKIHTDTVAGKLRVQERHLCQHGDLYEKRYSAPVGYNTDQSLADNAVKLSASLVSNEKQSILQAMEEGADPRTLSLRHLTTAQKYKQVIRSLMSGKGANVLRQAQIVKTLTDKQILSHFSQSQLDRIRSKMNYAIKNKDVLQADTREDL